MSATSKLLAREIVRLDVAIQAAARAHLWFDAQDLEEQRERAVDTRWSIMRREWVDQSREAVAWTSEHDVDRVPSTRVRPGQTTTSEKCLLP